MASKKSKSAVTKTATLELWGYAPEIGTAWVDSLDEVDDALADEVESVGGGHLELSDIEGRVVVDGKETDIKFARARKVDDGAENTWSEFRDEIGIYSIDIDKADCSAVFSFSGRFDPKKLTLHYKTAIGPGYFSSPLGILMELLDRVEYDGVELKLEYGDMRNNKGRVFTVFNKGKFASYNYGCGGDLSSLNWKTFAGDNWAKFGPEEWATILSGQPQFADKCKKWNEFGADEWVEILMYQPQFADRCDKWDEFGSDWSAILHNQPQLANKCNAWSEFSAQGWMDLLIEQPRFADHCDKWSDFKYMWASLLLSQPQFSEKCDKWGLMSAADWSWLLSKRPQFANKCDKWDTFKVSDWVRLLQGQPQFAEKCDKWGDFDCYDLARLAAAQDVFLPKFLSCEKTAPFAAAIVLAAKPDAGVDLSLLDGEVDYDDGGLFSHSENGFESPWAYLLSRQPQMAAKCKDEEWESFLVTDWLRLLSLQPSFAPRCDWSQVEGFLDEFTGPIVAKSEALISLVKANTSIDLSDGQVLGFYDLVQSPTLVKEFDPGVYEEAEGVSRAEQWSEILSRYPEMVSKFEADVWQEDDDDDF